MSVNGTASAEQTTNLLVYSGTPRIAEGSSSSLRAAAGRGLAWSAAERWGGQLLSVVVFTLLARLLDKPTFGAMALANLYIAFVQIFVTQGIGLAVIQRRDLRLAHLDTAFWMNLGAALTLGAVTTVFRRDAAEFLGAPEIAPVLAWLSLGLSLSALTVVPSALLSREMNFAVLARRSLAAAAISGGVGIGAALAGFGIWSLVAQQLTAGCASTILLWSSVSWRPGLQASRSALADLAPFSGTVITNDLLWLATQRVDQAFIGRNLGVEPLGAYAVSMRLVSIGFDTLAGPSQAVAMPVFAGIQQERERLGRAFLRSTALICSVAFPAFIGLMLLGPWLIPTLLGAKWTAAILPMQILCILGCLRAMQTFMHPGMMALGRTGAYTALFVLSAIASGLAAWLAAEHGIVAVAWAVVIATVVTAVANFAVLSRLLRFSFFAVPRTLWPIAMACAVLAAAAVVVQQILGEHVPGAAIAAAQAIAGAAAYAVSIALLDRALWMELRSTAKLLVLR